MNSLEKIIKDRFSDSQQNYVYSAMAFILGTILHLEYTPNLRFWPSYLLSLAFNALICFILGRSFPKLSWRWGLALLAPAPIILIAKKIFPSWQTNPYETLDIWLLLGCVIYLIVTCTIAYLGAKMAARDEIITLNNDKKTKGSSANYTFVKYIIYFTLFLIAALVAVMSYSIAFRANASSEEIAF